MSSTSETAYSSPFQPRRPNGADAWHHVDVTAATDPRPPRVAAVYGGGGLFGIAYNLGVAEALSDGGADLATIPALGTSAGTWAAAGLALGIRFLDALDAVADKVIRYPDPRPNRIRGVAEIVFGPTVRVPTLRGVACELPRFRRIVLRGDDHPAVDVIAASSSVPGMLAPHRIGRSRFVDGGVRSMASVDLADRADHLLVLLPLAGPMFGPAGPLMERRIRRETADWQSRNPDATVITARPDSRLAKIVRRPDQLFDPERARRCYELAYEQGVALRSVWLPTVSSTGGPPAPARSR